MYQYQDQKEMRRALNGKMIVMLVGIMLVMTALTSSLSYGIRCWSMAGMADKGNEEVLEALKQIDITSGTLRACSVVYYIQAVIETMVGIFCFRLNNRLDKVALLWKMSLGILGLEVLAGVALTAMHMISPFMIISNLLLPLFLLWAVSGLKKVAKNHPDRIYAVEPNNRKKGKEADKTSVQPKKAGQKKSLMEHATQVTPENITPLELTRELEKEDANVTEEVQEASKEEVAEVTETKEEKKEKKAPVKEEKKEPKKEFKKEVKKEAKPVREPKKETAAKPQTENKEVKPVAKEAQPKPEPRKPVVRTEEQVQQMKQDAEKFLTGVFGAMELPVEITMNYDKTADCLEIDFAGEDMGILIGKRGQTLDSLQYLTSLVVNKEQQDYVRVKVDTENYRSRRKDTLENLAKNIAFKVRKTRKPVVLEPMNPYERRIIHSALQGNKYVETYSEGNEPYRHVVVVYKGK